MNRAGLALVSVLFLSAAVAIFASALFGITFLDAAASANRTSGEIAFYAAEAGIEHTWALVAPAPSFAAELGWAGGPPPFGPVVDFPAAPASYRVTVTEASLERLSLESLGTAVRGARRRIEANLCRERAFAPAAPLVLASGMTVGLTAGTVSLDGTDRDAVLPATASLAIERADGLGGARRLSDEPAVELPLGSGLAAAAATLRESPDRTESGPFTNALFGAPAAPAVVRIVGDGAIAGSSTASGVVVADAPLRIQGSLDATGALVATAGLQVEGELRVAGLLYVAGSLDLHPGSHLEVTAASNALDAADRLRPGVFPRATVLCGWREVW